MCCIFVFVGRGRKPRDEVHMQDLGPAQNQSGNGTIAVVFYSIITSVFPIFSVIYGL